MNRFHLVAAAMAVIYLYYATFEAFASLDALLCVMVFYVGAEVIREIRH